MKLTIAPQRSDCVKIDPDPGVAAEQKSLHVIITANATWNVWNFRKPIVEALIADGHRVSIMAPADDCVAKVRDMGCDYIPLAIDLKGVSPYRDLTLLRDLRKIFSLEAPDLVLSYTIKNNIYSALAARGLRIPVIPNVSGLGTAFLSGGGLQWLVERLYRRAFASLPVVFFQNTDDRDLFLERRLVQARQTRLLPGSGIDLAHFSPVSFPREGTPPTFLLIARMLRDKGVAEFVEASRRIKAEVPEVRFQLLGPTGAENRTAYGIQTVQQWVQTCGVEYLGSVADVREHIAGAHCVVLPSYREGAPRTLIEAAALARPLIATDVPGCRSVVDDGVTGLLCQARSDESLTQACLKFLSLPREDQIAMGQRGRMKMEREFDQQLVIAAYRGAVADVRAGSGPASAA